MGPILGVWIPSERKLLERVHDRLVRTAGCERVRYVPSRIDANEVVCDVDPTVFLGRSSDGSARLRVEFDLTGDRPHYWIQWWEPNLERGFGWHCDETEPEYGPVHFQVEYSDGSTERESAPWVEDEHPYRTFERRFASIASRLDDLDW
ncbi:hypothetical protein Halru_2277 [Halovivax ruber XH-70]|uniref:Uncharacterized protein n=1 Tax=Halovivax ruber (strain DSM 18193 / JCM 13892 / XH-70) TaxID=797302 RepID=L0IDG8_HALRX|nr:hypothetical protein [Halovivax ruber]AGB16863.1 hypothetical protein Halru_2277 [Halovivax ruber XH-70]